MHAISSSPHDHPPCGAPVPQPAGMWGQVGRLGAQVWGRAAAIRPQCVPAHTRSLQAIRTLMHQVHVEVLRAGQFAMYSNSTEHYGHVYSGTTSPAGEKRSKLKSVTRRPWLLSSWWKDQWSMVVVTLFSFDLSSTKVSSSMERPSRSCRSTYRIYTKAAWCLSRNRSTKLLLTCVVRRAGAYRLYIHKKILWEGNSFGLRGWCIRQAHSCRKRLA